MSCSRHLGGWRREVAFVGSTGNDRSCTHDGCKRRRSKCGSRQEDHSSRQNSQITRGQPKFYASLDEVIFKFNDIFCNPESEKPRSCAVHATCWELINEGTTDRRNVWLRFWSTQINILLTRNLVPLSNAVTLINEIQKLRISKVPWLLDSRA